MSQTRESAIRAHIHQLLDSYSRTHLREDHLIWSLDAINKALSESLFELPLTDIADPSAIQVPEEPLDAVQRVFALKSIEPYDEKLVVPQDFVAFVEKLHPRNYAKIPKSSRVWIPEEPEYTSAFLPMEPILSRRSNRETINIGDGTLSAYYKQPLNKLDAKRLECEEIQDPQVTLDDALSLRLCFTQEEANASLAFIKDTAGMSRTGDPAPTSRSLQSDFASYELPEQAFEPLFPRSRYPGSNYVPQEEQDDVISQLPVVPLSPLSSHDPDSEGHIHLKAIDGWETLYVPSSPLRLSTPDSGQEKDELADFFMLDSPPSTEFTSPGAQMQEVIFTKALQVGGDAPRPEPLGNLERLDSLVLPLIRPFVTCTGHDQHAGLSSVKAVVSEEGELDLDTSDLDETIGYIYSKGSPNPILSEALDIKDEGVMDLPELPFPREDDKLIPCKMQDLLKDKESPPGSSLGFLNKFKVASLNRELSWEPYHAVLEDNLDLVGSDTSLNRSRGRDISKDTAVLFERILLANNPSRPDDFAWLSHGDLPATDKGLLHCEILLTKNERRRISGECLEFEDDFQDRGGPDVVPSISAYPNKRARLSHGDTGTFDDSGIGFISGGNNWDLGMERFEDRCMEPDLEKGPNADYAYNSSNCKGDRFQALDVFGEFGLRRVPGDVVGESQSLLNADHYNIPPELDHVSRNAANPLHTTSHSSDHLLEVSRIRSSLSPPRFEFSLADTDETVRIVQDSFKPLATSTPQASRPTVQPSTSSPRLFQIQAPRIVAEPTKVPKVSLAPTTSALSMFVQARSGKLHTYPPSPVLEPIEDAAIADLVITTETSQEIPDVVYDPQTLRLQPFSAPVVEHIYLASLSFLQKTTLVRALKDPLCSIRLVERESFGAVSLIVDPHSAISVVPLLPLPSNCSDLVNSICSESWRYSNILILFESFPQYQSYHSRRANEPTLNAFTAPVIKAIKTLRRALSIAEGTEKKRLQCRIWYAFARNVEEVAYMCRLYGDYVEGNDESDGRLWDQREAWIDVEPDEEEEELAKVEGMNPFAARVLMAQYEGKLQTFLDLSVEDRLEKSGDLVGFDRLTLLSELITQRTFDQEMNMENVEEHA